MLGRLPEPQREALLLSKYHDFSYREIASMTGTSEAAVKQRVYRALCSLREVPESPSAPDRQGGDSP